MKVIFSYGVPFYLSHGGCQTLIEELARALKELGVDVEWERWWDDTQHGDILHVFCRPLIINVRLAQAKGMKVIMTDMLDQTASRSPLRKFIQRTAIRTAKTIVPGTMLTKLSWEAYQELDGIVFVMSHEKETAEYLFDARPRHVTIINHATSQRTIEEMAKPAAEGDYLISTATIAPRKNTVMLARAAKEAGVPMVFLGKPYSDTDPYFLEFKSLMDGKLLRYPGFVSEQEKFHHTRGARGFVLLSQFETGCIAIQEAAAAGLPLLLSDLTWAHSYPASDHVKHVKLGSHGRIVEALRKFHGESHRLPHQTYPVLSWEGVAKKYLEFYRKALGPRAA